MTVPDRRLQQLAVDLRAADEATATHAAAVLRHLVSQSRLARRRRTRRKADIVLEEMAPDLLGEVLTKAQWDWLIDRLLIELSATEPPSHLPVFVIEECEDERAAEALLSLVNSWGTRGGADAAVGMALSALVRLGPTSAYRGRVLEALRGISAKGSGEPRERADDILAALDD